MKYTEDKIQQQIETYLNQDMSDLERSKFEKLIHDDPALHQEVEMQESIVQAIRNERILMIKAGLNQTNVSLWTASLLEAAKIAAVTVGLGLASVGGYYWYNSPANHLPAKSEATKPSSASVQSKEIVQNAPSDVVSPETFRSNPENANAPVVSSEVASSPKEIGQSSARTAHPNKTIAKASQPFGKEQALSETEALDPGMKQFVPSTAKDIAIPTDGISNKSSLGSLNPEVVIKRDNKDKFHYQFSDSKLILYADFSDKLYEVLELNQNNEKQLFFAYDGKFFSLDPKQIEIAPLKLVTDRNLIQILTDYQKRR